jgi:hypothetical protein
VSCQILFIGKITPKLPTFTPIRGRGSIEQFAAISEIGGNQAEKSTENDYGVGATGFGPSKYKRLSCQN